MPIKKTLRKPSRAVPVKTTGRQPWMWAIRVKDGFTALTAMVSFVAAVLGVLVLYANNKGAFADLKNDFYGWFYEEKAWTGLFNNYPEGYVDMASMELSDTSLQLVIAVNEGRVDGVISDRRLCRAGFPNDYKLLKGSIAMFGKTARLVAYDYVGGYEREYASFTVRRDGVVIEVKPGRDSEWLLPSTVRLAQHPEMDVDAGIKTLKGVCTQEYKELLDYLHKEREKRGEEPRAPGRKPASEY